MTTIIALLMALGLITSPGNFDNLNQTQQDELTQQVIITDEVNF